MQNRQVTLDNKREGSKRFRRFFTKWRTREDGTALVEASFILPVMLTMLMGLWDFGNAIMINQKVITASQMTADLIARHPDVDQSERDNAIQAARMAMSPYSTANMSFDIVSVSFDENGNPQEVGRELSTDTEPNQEAFDSTVGLGGPGEGALIVTIRYDYEPFFGSIMHIGPFQFEEVAYARGRKDAVIEFN